MQKENFDYKNWLQNLKYLKNKNEFGEKDSFEIKNGLRQIINFVEKDKIYYTIDRYGYYMWLHFPKKDRILYNRDYGLNNFSLIKKGYKDKVITSKILKENNISTPETYLIIHSGSRFSKDFNGLKGGLEFGEKVGYPLIRKPLDSSQGKGVIKIFNAIQLQKQFEIFNASEIKGHQILQPFIKGKDIRVVFLDGKIQLAYERIPKKIIGDGKNNIKKLIQNLDEQPQKYEEFIKNEGYGLDDILDFDKQLAIVPTANVSQGGGVKKYNFDENEQNFVKKVNDIFEATITGFDILTTSTLDKGVILELNSLPGFKGASQVEQNFEQKITGKMRQIIKKQEGYKI